MEKLLQNNILKHLNYKIINTNATTIFDIYKKMIIIYQNTNLIFSDEIQINIINNEKNDKFIFVKKYLQKSLLSNYTAFNNYLNTISKIYELKFKNITFYVTITKNDNEKCIMYICKKLIIISYSFLTYYDKKENITIIWCPINANRDFKYKNITTETLQESSNNFEAFSASGVTSNNTTVITRFEEIEKLLLHELVHNINIDGSIYHNSLLNIIKKYNNDKNKKNYNYPYCMYESYTELLSLYFSIVFRIINDKIFKNKNKHKNKNENKNENENENENKNENANENENENKILEKIKTNIIVETLHGYNTVCNLIKLNGHNNITYFIKNGYFKGNICFYEYYYLKALMCNNFILTFGTNIDDFTNIYEQIINIKSDRLIIELFKNSYPITNYKYNFYV